MTQYDDDAHDAVTDPHPRTLDDVEPCEHETLDRIITGTVTVVPILCLLIVAWQVWGAWLGWNDIFVFLIMYVAHRPRHHGRLPPPASRTARSRPRRSCAASSPCSARRRSRARSSRGSPTTASTTRSPTSRATRTARTSTTAAAGAARCAGLVHAHVGWLFLHTHRGRRDALRAGPDRRPGRQPRRPHVRALRRRSACSRRSASAGCSAARCATASPACCGAAPCACWSCTTRPTRSTRCATSSAAAASTPRTSRATSLWLSLLHVRRGVAQQPPRVPDLGRARAAAVGVRPLGLRHPRAGEGRPGVGRRARHARAAGHQARCRGLSTAPLRDALAEALPERPVPRSSCGTAPSCPSTTG